MAWCKELTASGDSGLEMFSKGNFHLFQTTFVGSWRSYSSRSGLDTKFKAIDISNQAATHIFQTSSTDSYIPVVPVTLGAAQNPAQNQESIPKLQGAYINH